MGLDSAPFDVFRAALGQGAAAIDRLRADVIGDGMTIDGPFGQRALVYADYVASGRAVRPVEAFMMEHVLPCYANTHTEASFCGRYMGRTREAARQIVARCCGASAAYATIFAGSGATAGLNRLVDLFGLRDAVAAARSGVGPRPVVLIGPYEHHSNILPWRESGAALVEIPEGAAGGVDLAALEAALASLSVNTMVIGAFSAVSNVSGIVTDVDAVSATLRRYGARVVWDYAGGAPYVPVDMCENTPFQKDAVVLSPHKFIGGPGSSGVLIVRREAVIRTTPVMPGGGTVRFVSPWSHDYSTDLVTREEAGTPNILGDIRAALVFLIKEAIGPEVMAERQEALRQLALAHWAQNPNIIVLGSGDAPHRLPIFSLCVRQPSGGHWVHQQLFTRMLSDVHGVQARGGCACAGPYAHRLLGIDHVASAVLRAAILEGEEVRKPGWVRLNLSVLLSDEKARHIVEAVDDVARNAESLAAHYVVDPAVARWRVREDAEA